MTHPLPLHGPEFGTFGPDDVRWLLTDLSHVELEASVDVRERLVQSGAHYSESLPVEYRPPEEYVAIFRELIRQRSGEVAYWTAVLAERLYALHGSGIVLASLARAGTPVGVLVRAWLQHAHGFSPPHYSLSIIRDKGLDPVALAYLREHHNPTDVVFVDGWTGKGVISRELASALSAEQAVDATRPAFRQDLAVVADPGGCTTLFGTRDDLMIPSACLNSTTCGLVSRTVHREGLIEPGQMHGAKFYRELLSEDQTETFLSSVRSHFDEVSVRFVTEGLPLALDAQPTWVGLAAVEKLACEYDLTDLNLVKPGIGETTRVLLRRVPWKIVVKSVDDPRVSHVMFLARQRELAVVEEPDLPFACVGIIREMGAQ